MHEKITERMRELGWSAERMAHEMQVRGVYVTAETVRSWMTGRRNPNYRNGCAIADVLGWSREEMMDAAGRSLEEGYKTLASQQNGA